MFDRYMLEEESLRSLEKDGRVTGFQVDVHYPHHCGIWLSIIEEMRLTVDGILVPAESLSLELDGKTYAVSRLGEEAEGRWYFGQKGTLKADYPGGLAEGTHEIRFRMGLRVSFLNWLLTGENTKIMHLKNKKEEEK